MDAETRKLLDPRAIARAANRLAGPEGRIGLFRESALLGGLVYYGRLYGNRPVVSLERVEDVTAFLAKGENLVVAGQRDLGEIPDLVQLESFRDGRRAIALAVPAHGESP